MWEQSGALLVEGRARPSGWLFSARRPLPAASAVRGSSADSWPRSPALLGYPISFSVDLLRCRGDGAQVEPCPARVVSATRRRAHHSQGVRSPTPATCARRVSPPSGQSPPIASTGHRPRSRCCGILLAACFPRWRQESPSLSQTQTITVAASAIAEKSVGGLRS